jgi:hypothetical protein
MMPGWYEDGSEEEAQMERRIAQRQIEERRADAAIEAELERLQVRIHEAQMNAAPDMYKALHLTLRLIEKERDVLERSFLPEPSEEEAEMLTEYEEATVAARAAIVKAEAL